MISGNIQGVILCTGSANKRRCYIVASSLICWAHAQIDLCIPSKGMTTTHRMLSIV